MKLAYTLELQSFIKKYNLEHTYDVEKEELKPLAEKVCALFIRNGINTINHSGLKGNVLAWIYASDSPLYVKNETKGENHE